MAFVKPPERTFSFDFSDVPDPPKPPKRGDLAGWNPAEHYLPAEWPPWAGADMPVEPAEGHQRRRLR